jgi:hypothetical protein
MDYAWANERIATADELADFGLVPAGKVIKGESHDA